MIPESASDGPKSGPVGRDTTGGGDPVGRDTTGRDTTGRYTTGSDAPMSVDGYAAKQRKFATDTAPEDVRWLGNQLSEIADHDLYDALSYVDILSDDIFRRLTVSQRIKILRGEFIWGVVIIAISGMFIAFTHKSLSDMRYVFDEIIGPAIAQSALPADNGKIDPKSIALGLVLADWVIIVLMTGFALWGAFVRRPPIGSARELLRTILAFATGQMATALGVLGFLAKS
jgi:hypothetical protein